MPRRCVSGTASLDVVDEIGEADFHGRSRNTDGANEQIHPVLLLREHMLNLGADFRFCVVGAPDRAGHGAPLWLFSMDTHPPIRMESEMFKLGQIF
jgi:hypothetical protein